MRKGRRGRWTVESVVCVVETQPHLLAADVAVFVGQRDCVRRRGRETMPVGGESSRIRERESTMSEAESFITFACGLLIGAFVVGLSVNSYKDFSWRHAA